MIAIIAEIVKRGEEKGEIFEMMRRIPKINDVMKLNVINRSPVPPNK